MKRIMLLGLLMFLVSCGGPQVEVGPTEEVQKGEVGLYAAFLEDAPPDEVIQKRGQLPVVIIMENKGGYDIENGIMTIIADEPIKVLKKHHSISLIGKELYDPVGERITQTLTAEVGAIAGIGHEFESSISATFCYPYETEATLNVCVDTDPFSLRSGEKVCQIGESRISGGQGGPIGITRIVTERSLDRGELIAVPSFKIYIDNLGGGELIRQGAVDQACKGRLERADFDEIEVDARLAGKRLNCGKKTLRLRDDETYVRCTLEEGVNKAQGVYISPLHIKMKYGYRFTIRQPITVLRE